jgi:ATP-dependent DNA helicase RecG
MTPENIKSLLAGGEGPTTACHACLDGLGDRVLETVCSFSNRGGGHLILGAAGNGDAPGVSRQAAPSMRRDFADMLRSRISRSLSLPLEEVEVDGRLLLYAHVPVSAELERCCGRIFDRVGDADVDVTTSSDRAAELYVRKSAMYSERWIVPFVTESDLRSDLVDRARKMAVSLQSGHPWANMSARRILRHSNLFGVDWRTGQKGYNLAAVLLFGRDDVIASCAPGYVTEAMIRRGDDHRGDRLTVGTNLLDAYDQLMGFIARHTMDKFFLIGDSRVSVRTWIAKELVSNLLLHREYSKGFPARLVIERERIYAENWNRTRDSGRIDPNDFHPYAKNPLLSWFFVNIGRADYLGSGVRNLYKYTRIYSGGEPELIEDDVFKTIIPLSPGSTPLGDEIGVDITDAYEALYGGGDIDRAGVAL